MRQTDRRTFLLGAALAPLAACSDRAADDGGQPAAEAGSLQWAMDGPWRLDPERDTWRHPLETLQFWGLQPTMTVLQVLPGRGWYTAILAPYLAKNGGQLIAASFDPNARSVAQRETLADFESRFTRDPERFGRIQRTIVTSGDLAPANSVDLAILDNNVHTLMAEGIAERVFAGVQAALKPGGVFGVEQHRAPSTGLQDPLAGTGYVQEAYVKTLAAEAGLEFVAATDVNANPRDDREHPFGVWTLPPTLRTAPLGRPDDPDFDTAPYEEIGESDRMTLKFRKPTGAAPQQAATPPPASP
jgi:predicted methyltransferase